MGILSSYAGYQMKYHTTVLNIIMSLCMLLGVCLLVAALAGNALLPSIGNGLIDYFLFNLNGDTGIQLSIGRIEGSIFKSLVMHEVSVTLPHRASPLLVAKTIIVDVPAYRLLSLGKIKGALPLVFIEPVLNINKADVDFLTQTSLFPSDKAKDAGSVEQLPIDVKIIHGAINLELDEFQFSSQSIQAEVKLSDGFLPVQGSFSLSKGFFTDGRQSASMELLDLRLGKTPDGNAGLAITGSDGVFLLDLFSSHSTLGSFSVSVVSPSNETLFKGTGALIAELDSFSTTFIQAQSTVTAKLVSLGLESNVQDFSLQSIGFHAQQGEVESSILNIEDASLRIPSFSGDLEMGLENDITLRFDSPVRIDAYQQDSPLSSVEDLHIESRFTNDLFTVRLGFSTLELTNPALFSDLIGFDLSSFKTTLFSKAHLHVTLDRFTSENFAELSLHVIVKSDKGSLEEIEGDIFANGKLNQKDQSIQAEMEIERLSISGLPGMSRIDLSYDLQPERMHQLEIAAFHEAGILLSGTYDLQADQVRTTIRLEDLHPSYFSAILQKHFPATSSFYDGQTVLEGNAAATFSADGSQGRGAGELGVAKVRIEDKIFNFASTIAGSFDSTRIMVDSATITTEGIRATFSGFLDRFSLFPQGGLFLSLAETGENLLSVEFSRAVDKSYEYSIRSPRFPEISLTGDVQLDSQRLLQAEAVLSIPGTSYPLTISADTLNGLFKLNSTDLSVLVDITSAPGHIALLIDADNFLFPEIHNTLMGGTLAATGGLSLDYALSNGVFLAASENLAFSGLSWGEKNPWTLSLDILADANELRMSEITYQDDLGEMSGYLKVGNVPLSALLDRSFDEFSAIFSLNNPMDATESVQISLFCLPQEKQGLRGQIIAGSIQTARFFPNLTPLLIDLNAIGSSNLRDEIDLKISAAFIDAPGSRAGLAGIFDVEIDDRQIQVIDGEFSAGIINISDINLQIPYQGISSLAGSLLIDIPSRFRDMHSELDFSLETVFDPSSDFFTMIPVFVEAARKPISVTLSLSDVLLFGSLKMPDGAYGISFDSKKISVSGGYRTNLSGYYDLQTNHFDLTATEDFLFGFYASGLLGADYISLLINSISFPLNILNPLFVKPVIEFTQGVAQGDLRIEGPSANPKYYGTLWADTVAATTFWTPGAHIFVKNPVVTISENRASIASTPLFSKNEEGITVSGYLNLEAGIERWNLQRYKLDLRLRENPVFVWVPIIDKDINLEAMVSGDFSIDGSRTEELLTGELIISDGYLGFGLPELPAWLVPEQRTSVSIGFTTGKNFIFVYPNRETPIVQAALADNQRMHITYDAPTMNIGFNGELAIRSGEIYYVQKNFYITEGSILMKAAVGAGANEVNPVLNLRARLREFDQNGNRLDVFLVLQDSTLDNLAPRFESVPYRTTNEILEILGRGIIPGAKFEETGLGSVVALATVATDVISRLGIFQANSTTYGFSQIIRDSLGLDVFTIRTNLLQNILYEAIPGTGTDNAVSPIARYLDNTTLYLGKYLFDDFYLQGMLHFRGDLFSAGKGATFLSGDLTVDTEISLEWNTPLALFSIFTQPDVLSIFNIFDTIGFSVTKRIVF